MASDQRAGRPSSEWSSGDPVLDAVYLARGYVLDHEDEMRSGWHEAATLIGQLRARGFHITHVDAAYERLISEPVAFIVGDDGKPWGPNSVHNSGPDSHAYDGRCAICRAGEHPEALMALVRAVVTSPSESREVRAPETVMDGAEVDTYRG